MRAEVDAGDFRDLARDWSDVADRGEDMRPAGYLIRERWLEGERRQWRARPAWTPRAASTLTRYRYPVRRGRRGPRRNPMPGNVGVYTGSLHVATTRPQQPGMRDTISAGRGGLTAIFGIKGRGPVAHGNLFQRGAGSRPAREVIVFDRQAHDDAASDVVDYLLGHHRRRTS